MHPVFIVLLVLSAVWFFICGLMAKKGIGVKLGLAIAGVIEFFVLHSVILTPIMKTQSFFLRAIRSGPDIEAILLYISLPTSVLVFQSGLLIKRVLSGHKSSETG